MDRQHLQRQIRWSEIKEKNISSGDGGGGGPIRGRRLWMWSGPSWKWNTWVQPWAWLLTCPVPRCQAWLSSAHYESPWCVRLICVSALARVHTAYIWWDGTQGEAVPREGDPWGEEEEGEATCLLAVAKWGWQPSTCLGALSFKTPSAHPLWDTSPPRGACDPRCCSVDWASCSYSLQPNKTATVHLRPEAFLGHYNTVQYMRDPAAGVCCFTVLCFFSSPFKVIQAPRPYVSDSAISMPVWLTHPW